MTDLRAAGRWHQTALRHTRLVGRLASRYWTDLPWDGRLGNDDQFRGEDPDSLPIEAAQLEEHLGDLAILVFFSVFEATICHHGLAVMKSETDRFTDPFAVAILRRAEASIESGSMKILIDSFSGVVDAETRGLVSQVRDYRNWVAHGRRGSKPLVMTPRQALDRLTMFLEMLEVGSTGRLSVEGVSDSE